jgi:integrase
MRWPTSGSTHATTCGHRRGGSTAFARQPRAAPVGRATTDHAPHPHRQHLLRSQRRPARRTPQDGQTPHRPHPEFLCPELEALTHGRDENELLVLTRRGQSLRANNWRTREFNAAIAAAGLDIDGLTPHKLRHTAASLAIAAGADVKVIQIMLGHKDASMTFDIYGHLFPDCLDEVANALDRNRTRALKDAA